MSEIEIDGHTYKIGRLDTFQQLYVGRRLGPGLVDTITSLSDIAAVKAMTAGDKVDLSVFQPLLRKGVAALAAMTDEDVNFVLMTCLGVVQRKQGDVWANVKGNGVARLMFEDISLVTMMWLVYRVIGDNLFPFFTGSGLASK